MNTSLSRTLLAAFALAPIMGMAAPAAADELAEQSTATPEVLASGAERASGDRGGPGGGIGYLVPRDGGDNGPGGGYSAD